MLSVTEALLSDGVTGPRWATALVSSAMCLLLLWRRTHPLAMVVALLLLAVPAAATLFDSSELIATFLPLLILAYSGGAYAGERDARIILAVLLAGVVTVGLLDEGATAGNVYFPVIIVTLCWLGGRTVGTRARHAAELHETAALAAERRERETQEAVAEERRRIAREMHDVVAHSISMMVIQAGGARRILATDPGRAEEAAARIRSAGTDALAEMDILLGVLEAAPDGTAPPKLDGLGELVERAREAGLPVTLEVNGERRLLSPGAELAVYRVVQEALTNAVKHAGGATTEVRLDVARGRARGERRRSRRRRREPAAPGRRARTHGHARADAGVRRRRADGPARRRGLRGRRAAAARAPDGGGVVSVRVLIVDDFELVREGIRMGLEMEPAVEIVGEAGDGVTAVAEAERLHPDVVLMDVRMPDMDGIEATRRIVALDGPPIRVLLLSTFDIQEYLLEALRAGISGITLKDTPPDELATGILAVAHGDALVDAETTVRLIRGVTRVRPPTAAPAGLTALSAREREVLELVGGGSTDAEIDGGGEAVAGVLAKLGVRDRIHAALLAHEARVLGA